jgi:hypothetical protein
MAALPVLALERLASQQSPDDPEQQPGDDSPPGRTDIDFEQDPGKVLLFSLAGTVHLHEPHRNDLVSHAAFTPRTSSHALIYLLSDLRL